MRKVLLDENLPRPLAKLFTEPLVVYSVYDFGWAEKKNGELIKAMLDEKIELLLTANRNLRYQQNLNKYPIKLAILHLYDNRLKSLLPHVQLIQDSILAASDSEYIIDTDLRGI
jgi:hypothetical protein